MIDLYPDFQDLLLELRAAGAEFVIVGGYAVAHHGHARATKDLDVFVRPDDANAVRVIDALRAFGAPIGPLGISADEFRIPGNIVQLGVAPVRIDLLTHIDGVSFDEAIHEAGTIRIGSESIPVIGLEALLRNKRATGRLQDRADVEALERLVR